MYHASRTFISYRRVETQHTVDRLFVEIERHFGRRHVFKDDEQGKIRLGAAYRTVLEKEIIESDIILVVIGQGWIEEMQRRDRTIGFEFDDVGFEIQKILALNKIFIPVLVRRHSKDNTTAKGEHLYFDPNDYAGLPEAKALPPPIQALADHQDPVFHLDATADDSAFRTQCNQLAALARQRILTHHSVADDPQRSGILPGPFEWCEVRGGVTNVQVGGQMNQVEVEAFRMAKYPITKGQFEVFVNDPHGFDSPVWWDFSEEARFWLETHELKYRLHQGYTNENRNEPLTNLTWYDAIAFCRWLTSRLHGKSKPVQNAKVIVTLPSEAQWQRAALGDRAEGWPWGEQFDGERCNSQESGPGRLTAVDRYPEGASPFGVVDMSGNCQEWCLNLHENVYDAIMSTIEPRAIRGGFFDLKEDLVRSPHRNEPLEPGRENGNVGFRVALVYHQ